MKTRTNIFKAGIYLFVVLLLFISGVTYSAWSDTLFIRGIFTTADFRVEYGDKNDIEVSVISMDSNNNITEEDEITEFTITKNDDKNISISLKGESIDKLIKPGYMLRIIYPIKTADDSKIKSIKPQKANFKKPYETVYATPVSVKIISEGDIITVSNEINKDDYKLRFQIYRQIEADGDKSRAVLFLKVDDAVETLIEIPVEYSELISVLPNAGISQEKAVINAQVEVEYIIKVSIAAEQFNNQQQP